MTFFSSPPFFFFGCSTNSLVFFEPFSFFPLFPPSVAIEKEAFGSPSTKIANFKFCLNYVKVVHFYVDMFISKLAFFCVCHVKVVCFKFGLFFLIPRVQRTSWFTFKLVYFEPREKFFISCWDVFLILSVQHTSWSPLWDVGGGVSSFCSFF